MTRAPVLLTLTPPIDRPQSLREGCTCYLRPCAASCETSVKEPCLAEALFCMFCRAWAMRGEASGLARRMLASWSYALAEVSCPGGPIWSPCPAPGPCKQYASLLKCAFSTNQKQSALSVCCKYQMPVGREASSDKSSCWRFAHYNSEI